MSIDAAMATTVSGLHASALAFRAAANNVVNIRSDGYLAEDVKITPQIAGGNASGSVLNARIVETDRPVDYAAEAVTMIEARITYTANAKIIGRLEEMSGMLLDILA